MVHFLLLKQILLNCDKYLITQILMFATHFLVERQAQKKAELNKPGLKSVNSDTAKINHPWF